MNRRNAVVWWPPIGLLAMVVLGLAVRSGSTRIDGWFTDAGMEHRALRRLLFFTDLRVLLSILVVCVAVAVYQRRWRLATAIVLTPAIAIAVERLAKRAFGRTLDGALAYPSGHTTLLVVLLGWAVVVAGGAMWIVVVAIAFGLLGLVGQAVTYHYFTDTIGGVLLGTSLLCLVIALPRGSRRRT